MTSLYRDLRHSLRGFARRPGWTALAVLTLAVGIGANTSLFAYLSSMLWPTVDAPEPPRVECKDDGVLQVQVPWAEPGSRFTALFEALIIDWLKEASISAVARLSGLPWEAVDGIQQRAVRRGRARRQLEQPALPKRLGVDETSFRRRHDYVTVVLDQDEDTVVHVAARQPADRYAVLVAEEPRGDGDRAA